MVPVLGETPDDIAFTHYGAEKYYFSIAKKILSTSSTYGSLFKLNAHDAIHVRTTTTKYGLTMVIEVQLQREQQDIKV